MIGPIKVTTPIRMSNMIISSLTRYKKAFNVVRIVNFRKQDKKSDFYSKINFVKTKGKESDALTFRQCLNLQKKVAQSRPPETAKTSDVSALAREAAFSGLNRALQAGKFDADTFKDQFEFYSTGSGSLRTMITALQGTRQFEQGYMKKIADELLSTEISGVKFSQFGTYPGPASDLISAASKSEMEHILSAIETIYKRVEMNLIGTEV